MFCNFNSLSFALVSFSRFAFSKSSFNFLHSFSAFSCAVCNSNSFPFNFSVEVYSSFPILFSQSQFICRSVFFFSFLSCRVRVFELAIKTSLFSSFACPQAKDEQAVTACCCCCCCCWKYLETSQTKNWKLTFGLFLNFIMLLVYSSLCLCTLVSWIGANLNSLGNEAIGSRFSLILAAATAAAAPGRRR